jgi:hypothetical protein
MKCNETLSKWCKNKLGASKIMDTLETYHAPYLSHRVHVPGTGTWASSGSDTRTQGGFAVCCARGDMGAVRNRRALARSHRVLFERLASRAATMCCTLVHRMGLLFPFMKARLFLVIFP